MGIVIEKQLENRDTSSEEMSGPVEENDRSEDWSSDVYREALEKELRRREEVGTTSEEEEINDGVKHGSGAAASRKLFGMSGERKEGRDDDIDWDEILKRAAMLRI